MNLPVFFSEINQFILDKTAFYLVNVQNFKLCIIFAFNRKTSYIWLLYLFKFALKMIFFHIKYQITPKLIFSK